jgi:hypothetical protein
MGCIYSSSFSSNELINAHSNVNKRILTNLCACFLFFHLFLDILILIGVQDCELFALHPSISVTLPTLLAIREPISVTNWAWFFMSGHVLASLRAKRRLFWDVLSFLPSPTPSQNTLDRGFLIRRLQLFPSISNGDRLQHCIWTFCPPLDEHKLCTMYKVCMGFSRSATLLQRGINFV